MFRTSVFNGIVLLFLTLTLPAQAQWTTQSVSLVQGWNAVFLEAAPYPSETDLAFKNLPVDRVWTFDPRFSPTQFLTDADELLEESPNWRVFFPMDRAESVVNNLKTLQPAKAYLIKAATDFEWTVKGRPLVKPYEWTPNSYNLTGFYVDSNNAPTFADWFSTSGSHTPIDVWQLEPDGRWVQLDRPSSKSIESGRAYWVYCEGNSTFQGPVEIELDQPDELFYLDNLAELNMRVRHLGSGERQLRIDTVLSGSVPEPVAGAAEELDESAGGVELSWFKLAEDGQPIRDYVDFPAIYDLAEGDRQVRRVSVALDRSAMSPAESPDALYMGILEVSDGQGYLRKIGVRAEPAQTGVSKAFQKLLAGRLQQSDPPAEVGLWYGLVTVDKVTEPKFQFADPDIRSGARLPNVGTDALTDAPAAFTFPILFHVDAEDNIRLLGEVTQLYREELTQPDPNDPDRLLIIEEGRPILMTADAPEELLNELGGRVVGATLRDGRPFANRVTTPMFSLRDADGNPESSLMQRTGASIYEDGAELAVTLVMEDNDPLNPFRHQYHPMHRYPEEGQQVPEDALYEITRQIQLTFTSDPPSGEGGEPGQGDQTLAGVFREGLDGLRYDRIFVEGTFRVYRLSKIPVLNDGLGFAN